MPNKKNLQIVPFQCPECLQPLQALPRDEIYHCGHCQTGLVLRHGRIQKHPLRFLKPELTSLHPTIFLPFWSFQTRGLLFSRETHAAFKRGELTPIRIKKTSRENPPTADGRRAIGTFDKRFYIPAFTTTETVRMGAIFTSQLQNPKETDGPKLVGGEMSETEARQAADLVYIFFEAARPDYLKSLDFKLELSDPCIMAIPFARSDADEKKVSDLLCGYRWPTVVFEDWDAIESTWLAKG